MIRLYTLNRVYHSNNHRHHSSPRHRKLCGVLPFSQPLNTATRRKMERNQEEPCWYMICLQIVKNYLLWERCVTLGNLTAGIIRVCQQVHVYGLCVVPHLPLSHTRHDRFEGLKFSLTARYQRMHKNTGTSTQQELTHNSGHTLSNTKTRRKKDNWRTHTHRQSADQIAQLKQQQLSHTPLTPRTNTNTADNHHTHHPGIDWYYSRLFYHSHHKYDVEVLFKVSVKL